MTKDQATSQQRIICILTNGNQIDVTEKAHLHCPCGRECQSSGIRDDAWEALLKLRGYLTGSNPLYVVAADRCAHFNRLLGYPSHSRHVSSTGAVSKFISKQSVAFDIRVGTRKPFDIYHAAMLAGFKGFGFLKEHGVIHVDLRKKHQVFHGYVPSSIDSWGESGYRKGFEHLGRIAEASQAIDKKKVLKTSLPLSTLVLGLIGLVPEILGSIDEIQALIPVASTLYYELSNMIGGLSTEELMRMGIVGGSMVLVGLGIWYLVKQWKERRSTE